MTANRAVPVNTPARRAFLSLPAASPAAVAEGRET